MSFIAMRMYAHISDCTDDNIKMKDSWDKY